MRYDQYALAEDDDDKKKRKKGEKQFKDFECPSCSAENHAEFDPKDEVMCYYCGVAFEVKLIEEGRYLLKEA